MTSVDALNDAELSAFIRDQAKKVEETETVRANLFVILNEIQKKIFVLNEQIDDEQKELAAARGEQVIRVKLLEHAARATP